MYVIIFLVKFSFFHLVFWSGNLFLIVPFPDCCLLVPFQPHIVFPIAPNGNVTVCKLTIIHCKQDYARKVEFF